MVEKYTIQVKKFGSVNWMGAFVLFQKETQRFLSVSIQTIFSPVLTSVLFLLVLSLALGSNRADMMGFPFITFLAPGLIAMSIIQQAFSHSSSSFIISKIQGTITDLIMAPLSAGEVTIAITLASVTRSFIIAMVSIPIFYLLADIEIRNFYILIFYTFVSSFILGALGIIAGLWADKFDSLASINNFIIIPLSFLSATFYTIDRLPPFLQIVSKCNPFFYMIDGFRYGFLEKSDGSIFVGSIYLTILAIVLWFVSYLLYKRGYKIKS